jgi:rubrerythrin
MPLDTVDDLREHLQLAIQIELTTIPPYLYAMYSIEDRANTATKLIRSVAAEEMLHATLMANILLGVGGEPRFYDPEVIPRYPAPLPHHTPELVVELAPCTPDVIESVFLTIERPGVPGAPDEADCWESQGQLYHAVENAMRRLDGDGNLFATPQRDRQLHDPHGYVTVKYDSTASGGMVVVDSLERAIEATEVAVHQGEGLSDDRFADKGSEELTHYSKFLSILDGEVEVGPVRNAMRSPHLLDLPEHIQPLARFSNALYSYLFVVMDRLFAPDTPDRHHLVGTMYGSMVALLAPVARCLMTLPVSATEVAGPPFEFYEFADANNAEQELCELGAPLATAHPSLAPALAQLDRL